VARQYKQPDRSLQGQLAIQVKAYATPSGLIEPHRQPSHTLKITAPAKQGGTFHHRLEVTALGSSAPAGMLEQAITIVLPRQFLQQNYFTLFNLAITGMLFLVLLTQVVGRNRDQRVITHKPSHQCIFDHPRGHHAGAVDDQADVFSLALLHTELHGRHRRHPGFHPAEVAKVLAQSVDLSLTQHILGFIFDHQYFVICAANPTLIVAGQ